MPTDNFRYIGSELELFAKVHNWKTYWSSQLQPFIHGDTLEVGAGMGTNTPYLDSRKDRRWVCLEPDPPLKEQLLKNLETNRNPSYEVICGQVKDLEPARQFDTIVYIDVLEHIEDDKAELEVAAARLKPGGRVIVLSPAHQALFTPFDAAIGHFRRYNRSMLSGLTPLALHLEKIWYLDSVGLLLSLSNRLFMRQSMPTKNQLHFWDQFVVPVSRVLDKGLAGSVGKSIVAIWSTKQEDG